MRTVSAQIEVAVSAARAFDFVATIENLPRWQSGVVSARQTSPGPLGMGSTGAVTQQIAGQRVEAHVEVTTFEPPRHVVLEGSASGIELRAELRVEPLDPERSRVGFELQIRAGSVFLKPIEPMIESAAAQEIGASLARLRAALEGDPTA